MVQKTESSPGFVYVGRLCLDFLMTGGRGERRVYERLTSAARLRDWLAESSLGLRIRSVKGADLLAAEELREALWLGVKATLERRMIPAASRHYLNDVARTPNLVHVLTPANDLKWDAPGVDAALSTIARDAVDLLGSSQAQRIRVCSNPECGIIFYDNSRPGTRRWCAGNRCGDRIRARTYRKRKRPL